ncbi:hypothetical protein ACSTHR_23265, partial [Vibrio parahaemolyticus]
MDIDTQQNAAMAEQTNAAARGLSEQSTRLAAMVARFKLERRERLRQPGEKWTGHRGESAAGS